MSDARTYEAKGFNVTEHEFSLPLDHSRPEGVRIGVFAREVAAPGGSDRPFLVYFQGGPGFEASRPTVSPPDPLWVRRAVTDYRVLLLDQRGTGRSTPVGALPGLTASEQAEHLAHFRADSIVRDAESIRRELGVERWSVLGQSFGGFWCHHLPLDRTLGSAGGVRRRRLATDRSAHGRGLSAHLPTSARAQPTVLRALSG